MQFKKLGIQNFKAIGNCEICLERQGFVAIRGINNTDPNTANCGTGKSSISDALSYALCGETVKGGTDVKNQYTDGDCSVWVEFEKSEKEYRIERTKGKALILFENGLDISGKGIRDTQLLIEQLFPEFTPEFIGATVIFGQKMPNAFTANSASKRKEILERLTKSDFQIEDIKSRLTTKKEETAKALRLAEDERLTIDVTLNQLKERHNECIFAQDALPSNEIIEDQIECKRKQTKALSETLSQRDETIKVAQAELDKLQQAGTEFGDKLRAVENSLAKQKENELAIAYADKERAVGEARDSAKQATKQLQDEFDTAKDKETKTKLLLTQAEAHQTALERESEATARLKKQAEEELEKIKKSTVCPTCGKPWGDDEHKIDLSPYQNKVVAFNLEWETKQQTVVKNAKTVSAINSEYSMAILTVDIASSKVKAAIREQEQKIETIIAKAQSAIDSIQVKYNNDNTINEMMGQLNKMRQDYASQRRLLNEMKDNRDRIREELETTKKEEDSAVRRLKETETRKKELGEQIKLQEDKIRVLENNSQELAKRVDSCKTRTDQLNKLYNFAIKRFRTILLEDTISLLEEKAKTIAAKYFDVDIAFAQEGAAIEIKYQGKQFENLSGGEECAAVLVIQTALRELLFDLTGEESNVLFIDECTDGADIALSEKIMSLVGEYNAESVFIISHHEELNLPTDRTMIVEKNNNVAEVYWE